MSEKFSLKWNDFETNWKRSLSQLRTDNDLADVTIITDDKVKFKAHKILLSSCSETFKFILKEFNQAQSILYLNGVNSVNLRFILDYIYYSEVNLFQEQLDSFVQSAEKLEIQGLVGYGHSRGAGEMHPTSSQKLIVTAATYRMYRMIRNITNHGKNKS